MLYRPLPSSLQYTRYEILIKQNALLSHNCKFFYFFLRTQFGQSLEGQMHGIRNQKKVGLLQSEMFGKYKIGRRSPER